jgi:hypothetical protein
MHPNKALRGKATKTTIDVDPGQRTHELTGERQATTLNTTEVPQIGPNVRTHPKSAYDKL